MANSAALGPFVATCSAAEVVAEEFLGVVKPGWWFEPREALNHHDPPLGMVQEPMMSGTHECQVVEVGGSPVDPRLQVVGVAPSWKC